MFLHALIAMLACGIHRHQEHVITYLREENCLLKAQLKGRRLILTDTERRRLAVLAHPLDRKRLKAVATIATAETLQHWYRRLVDQAVEHTIRGKTPGRPRVATEIEALVVRMAEENASWGYRRIQGALANVGYHIDKITVRNILRRHHIDPAPTRRQMGLHWSQFLYIHWEVLAATACVTEGRETLAGVGTSVVQWGSDRIIQSIHLAGLLHDALRGVMTRWLLLLQRLWAGVLWTTREGLAPCETPCAGILVRRDVGYIEPSRVIRLGVSSPPSRQWLVRRVQQERDPPAARWAGRTVVTPYRRRESSTPQFRLQSVPRRESNGRQVRSQSRHGSLATATAEAAA
jgi:hypothetical protein